jgi:putative ABC transport system ATP-binding protein
MIRLERVTKVFNPGRHNAVEAVRGVDLLLQTGAVTVIRGPSGSGKTTLLAMIGALTRPTAGRIRLDDRVISNLPERFMAQVRQKTFGFVFQRFNLIRGLSVLENVMLAGYPPAPPHAMLRSRALRLLAQFELETLATTKVEWLSGGEAQRVAICRALLNDPSIVIADEPTANLDSALSADVVDLLCGLSDAGKTVLISSHDPIVFDAARVSRVVTMRDGSVIED